jgi:hypothetical protein
VSPAPTVTTPPFDLDRELPPGGAPVVGGTEVARLVCAILKRRPKPYHVTHLLALGKLPQPCRVSPRVWVWERAPLRRALAALLAEREGR